MSNPPPIQLSSSLGASAMHMSVQEVDTGSHIPVPPAPPPLPHHTGNPAHLGGLGHNAQAMADESPNGSVNAELGSSMRDMIGLGGDEVTLGGQIIGIKGSTLKTNFKEAMKKDGQNWEDSYVKSKPLRFLKRAARVSGLVLGVAINLTAKVVAIGVAAAAAPVVMMGYTIAGMLGEGESTIWHNPREALAGIFGGATAAGAGAGAMIGVFGNLLIKASLSMEYEKGDDIGSKLKEDFTQAFTDNVAAGAIGSSVGSVASLVNPVLWRAAWVQDTGV